MKLLRIDPLKRIGINQMRNHFWFMINHKDENDELDPNIHESEFLSHQKKFKHKIKFEDNQIKEQKEKKYNLYKENYLFNENDFYADVESTKKELKEIKKKSKIKKIKNKNLFFYHFYKKIKSSHFECI